MAENETIPPCPRCKGRAVKCGNVLRAGGKVPRFQCTECGYPFTKEAEV